MNYTIQAKYKNGEFEEIDSTSSRKNAIFLKSNYVLAFGYDYTIKITKK